MDKSVQNDFERCVAILAGDRPHRVWSLVVTLFGDLAQSEVLSGAVLGRVTEPIGIRPEALRVALHRLRKDGWIESRRSGRTSDYMLSARGREISAAATPRIYATGPDRTTQWHVLVGGPMDTAERQETERTLLAQGYMALGGGAYLGKGAARNDHGDFLAVDGQVTAIPDWLRAQCGDPELAQSCRQLALALTRVRALLRDRGHDLGPLATATLRILIVHSWRRIVLRHPDLPPEFFPDDWQGETCRAMTLELLALLPRPSVKDLAAEIS